MEQLLWKAVQIAVFCILLVVVLKHNENGTILGSVLLALGLTGPVLIFTPVLWISRKEGVDDRPRPQI